MPAALALGVMSGCGDSVDGPLVVGVSPTSAYTDGPVVLRVETGRVRPAVRLNVGHGSLATELASVEMSLTLEDPVPSADTEPMPLETIFWEGAGTYWVRTPPGLAEGRYRLELVDPRGQTARFSEAFQALGRDTTAPSIAPVITTGPPMTANRYIVAGTQATVEITADDGPLGGMAHIAWSAESMESGACPLPGPDDHAADVRARPPQQMTCIAKFIAPALEADGPISRPFQFTVTVTDIAGNVTSQDISLTLAKAPLIYSFFDMVGALGGYQTFVVRGKNFLPESQAFIGDVPIIGARPGGVVPDQQSILGWTPPHGRAETVSVEVRSPAGSAFRAKAFTYLSPPRPRDIQPPVGPARGGIVVSIRGNDFRAGMIVYVGATRGSRQPLYRARLVTPNQLVGCLPPGLPGPASIWTYDPVAGDGELPDVFSYQDDSGSPSALDATCQ